MSEITDEEALKLIEEEIENEYADLEAQAEAEILAELLAAQELESQKKSSVVDEDENQSFSSYRSTPEERERRRRERRQNRDNGEVSQTSHISSSTKYTPNKDDAQLLAELEAQYAREMAKIEAEAEAEIMAELERERRLKEYSATKTATKSTPKPAIVPSFSSYGSKEDNLTKNASPVLDDKTLWVGSEDSMYDMNALQNHEITHILIPAHLGHGDWKKYPDSFTYKKFHIDNVTGWPIIFYFPEMCDFITDALNNGGRVLVCCSDGLSRAPSTAVAFFMKKFKWDKVKAWQHIKARKTKVIDQNFDEQLTLWHGAGYSLSGGTLYHQKIEKICNISNKLYQCRGGSGKTPECYL